ncbi:MAG: SAV0927 family protein, partial [Clostridia bacterium]
SRFFGKPLVICMQTGLSALLGSDDANRPGYLQKAFRLRDEREAEELARMFLEILPALQLAENQY